MKLIVVDGGKGGVGKSYIATAVADRLLAAGGRVAAIDGDTTNPDFARTLQSDEVPTAITTLSSEESVSEMLALLEQFAEGGTEYVVLSLAAGISGIEDLRAIAAEALEEMNVEVVTLFVLSKLPDSVNLASRSHQRGWASLAHAKIAITNGLFGPPEDFTRWRESSARQEWLADGGLEAHVRELYYRTADAIRESASLPSEILPALSTVYRIQLNHWLREFDERVMRPAGLPCPPPPATARDGEEQQEREEAAA